MAAAAGFGLAVGHLLGSVSGSSELFLMDTCHRKQTLYRLIVWDSLTCFSWGPYLTFPCYSLPGILPRVAYRIPPLPSSLSLSIHGLVRAWLSSHRSKRNRRNIPKPRYNTCRSCSSLMKSRPRRMPNRALKTMRVHIPAPLPPPSMKPGASGKPEPRPCPVLGPPLPLRRHPPLPAIFSSLARPRKKMRQLCCEQATWLYNCLSSASIVRLFDGLISFGQPRIRLGYRAVTTTCSLPQTSLLIPRLSNTSFSSMAPATAPLFPKALPSPAAKLAPVATRVDRLTCLGIAHSRFLHRA